MASRLATPELIWAKPSALQHTETVVRSKVHCALDLHLQASHDQLSATGKSVGANDMAARCSTQGVQKWQPVFKL